MPEQLEKSELHTDPTVAKQWDNDIPLDKKFEDFAAIADKLGVCMLGTVRESVKGAVTRSMAVAKRTGPDFLFLANANSQKFDDLEKSKTVNISFQNTSNRDWISVTGEAVTTSNDDPRIKQIYSKMVSAWFGDLGDGVHTSGGPEDPRIKLIEVKAHYISYWQHSVMGGVGFMVEATAAMATGGVANTGNLRQFTAEEIDEVRSRYSDFSS